MKLLTSILLVIGVARYVEGLTCYQCDVASEEYNGYPAENCLHSVTSGGDATGIQNCLGTAGTVEYCLTTFVIRDGVVTEATRGCALAGSDHDTNSDAVPSADQCMTALDTGTGNPTGLSTCYFPCTGDNCNTKSAVNVLKCASDCNSLTSQGTCNYITGTCVCAASHTGADCSTPVTVTAATPATPRKCVQCNSESDTSCKTTPTAAVVCPAGQQYCSTTNTTIYTSDHTTLKTVVVRGCTYTYSTTDECFFTQIFSDPPINDTGAHEVTCVSTCDTDGCNTNTANGVIDGDEAIPLYCVVCQDTTGDISTADTCATAKSTTRTRCPSGSTHCKSTVSYLISERTDLSFSHATPVYRVRNIDRGCATAEVTTGCTETDFSTHKAVNCTETCQEDGCNVGWPARPNCIQCETGSSPDDYDECLENPPEATMCTYPFQANCIIVDRGIQKGIRESIQGYPRRIQRTCSHIDIGTACTTTKYRECEVENCNRTCTTDGCNVGSGSSMAIQTMVAVVVPAILGWLAQTHL